MSEAPFLYFLQLIRVSTGHVGRYMRVVTTETVRMHIGYYQNSLIPPILVAARSEAWVCSHSLVGNCGFESRRAHEYLSRVIVVCCQVEVTTTRRSFVLRSITECGVSECDLETSTLRSLLSTRAFNPRKGKRRSKDYEARSRSQIY